MLSQIKELLANAQLQQKIEEATNLAESIKLIMAAGAEKGYNFTTEAISQMLTDLNSVESYELNEEELLSVSGAMMSANHTNKDIDWHCTAGCA
ncbi:MAG: Nif11-like leader peptide family natural product precursor [Nostoc sp.]|uniref:Nif11-like leader peptide family natural product precursor n=1 Tax=Nostoc sp. TaxID=1180 RepID=UPI002FF6BFF5